MNTKDNAFWWLCTTSHIHPAKHQRSNPTPPHKEKFVVVPNCKVAWLDLVWLLLSLMNNGRQKLSTGFFLSWVIPLKSEFDNFILFNSMNDMLQYMHACMCCFYLLGSFQEFSSFSFSSGTFFAATPTYIGHFSPLHIGSFLAKHILFFLLQSNYLAVCPE